MPMLSDFKRIEKIMRSLRKMHEHDPDFAVQFVEALKAELDGYDSQGVHGFDGYEDRVCERVMESMKHREIEDDGEVKDG